MYKLLIVIVSFFLAASVSAGSCQNATQIATSVELGDTSTDLQIGSICANVAPFTMASWYFLNGTGGTFIASTCLQGTLFRSRIAIFNITDGDPSCGTDIMCTLSPTTTNGESCATVSFTTEIGRTYYIAVIGATFDDSGPFGLRISLAQAPTCADNVTNLPTGDLIQVDNNTTSESAAFIPSYGSLPQSIRGDWFRLIGDGRVVTVSTCDPATNFDTALVVFEQEPRCFHCYCSTYLTFNDSSSSQLCSTVSFSSIAGRSYLLFVGGADSTSFGSYRLTISRPTLVAPANPPVAPAPRSPPVSVAGNGSTCVGAIPITLNVPVSRTLRSTTSPASPIPCRSESSPRNGFWFRFVAPFAGNFVVHTCEPEPSMYLYSSIIVYDFAGSNVANCDRASSAFDLQCEESNSASGAFNCGAVSMTLTANQVKYIYATSWSSPSFSSCPGSSCTFSVTVTTSSRYALAPSASTSLGGSIDICSKNVQPAEYGPKYAASFATDATGFPSPMALMTCGILNRTNGVWYSTRGDSRDLTFTTCFEDTTASTVIAVFEGSSCGSVSCEATSSVLVTSSSSSSRSSPCTLPGRSSVTITSSSRSDTLYIFVGQATEEYPQFQLSGDKVSFQIVSERAQRDLAVGLGVGLGVGGFFVFFILLSVCLVVCQRRSARRVAPAADAVVVTQPAVTAYAAPAVQIQTTYPPQGAMYVQGQGAPDGYPPNSVQMNTYYGPN